MSGRKGILSVVVVGCLALLSGAATAWAALTVTNVYSVNVRVRPAKSGTRRDATPVSLNLRWDVGAVPAGERPANVIRYAISFQGIEEKTRLFPRCATSRLAAAIGSCPKGSKIGSGFLIFELGATGFSNAGYNPTCTLSLAVFNGGHHDLTLFVYEGTPGHGQPYDCTIKHGHVAIHVKIRRSGRGITETFTMPPQLLHPVRGFDTAVIRARIRVPAKQEILAGTTTPRRVGLFDSFLCPRTHQRQVTMTFLREDGVVQTSASAVRCR